MKSIFTLLPPLPLYPTACARVLCMRAAASGGGGCAVATFDLMVFSANLENAPRYTHLRWATIFAEKSHRLLDAVLDYAEIDAGLMELFEVYQSQALDPNVNRKRLMDQWRA